MTKCVLRVGHRFPSHWYPRRRIGAVAEMLVSLLTARGGREILGFDAVQDEVNDEAYRWDLWAAAYLINGGCSDDGFDYFRGWLMAQGRQVWDDALADPDSLAALFPVGEDDTYEGEGMAAVTATAYAELTGDSEAFCEAVQQLREQQGEPPVIDGGPVGELFDFDDPAEMRVRLSRLAALFLDDE